MIDRNRINYNSEGSSDEIRSSIDRTRDEMDHTLDELGERLHPKHLLDDVIGLVSSYSKSSGSTGAAKSFEYTQELSHYATSIGRTILYHLKKNPGPALLFGAGLAWMIWNESKAEERRRRGIPYPYGNSMVDARTGRPYGPDYGRHPIDDPRYPYVHTSYGETGDGGSHSYENPEEARGSKIIASPTEANQNPESGSHIITDPQSTTSEEPGKMDVGYTKGSISESDSETPNSRNL